MVAFYTGHRTLERIGTSNVPSQMIWYSNHNRE